MSENLPNKAVFQSYIWTCAKYDFSPYEKRIIYRLIEFAQHWLEGVKIKDHMHKIEPMDVDFEQMTDEEFQQFLDAHRI